MQKANRYLGFFSIAAAIVIMATCYFGNLTLIVDRVPGPGFLPFWTAAGILICGVLILIGALKKKPESAGEEKPVFEKAEYKNFAIVIGASVFVILLSPYLGMVTALGLGVGTIAKLLGTKSWKTVVCLAIGSGLVFYLLFMKFLAVPLPVNALGF